MNSESVYASDLVDATIWKSIGANPAIENETRTSITKGIVI